MNKRIGNLEFRWTQKYGKDSQRYPEIVRWFERDQGDPYCFTLLYWIQDSEGWNINFVGNRPFDDSDWDRNTLWQLMQYGQTVANAEFHIQRFHSELEAFAT